jgi:signal transduction histidine kinase
MGMGLAYGKRIVAQHGGKPAAQSVLGIDSRFDLRLRLDAGR